MAPGEVALLLVRQSLSIAIDGLSTAVAPSKLQMIRFCRLAAYTLNRNSITSPSATM